ncbi:hypothetical protein PHET_03085 [Paragonimus heterotremus]|uniref:DIX domain-containing protein n=1 Tax=Paragonimus heterotremus TaxID=100268 RepID=A0A8J4T056_9TREM|nr:hypothetical protein PHET_03085 [Paragonimus heterotremus]
MTSRFALDTPRLVDRYPFVDIRSLHDFLHLCSQYDAAHQAGNYELGGRIVQNILETYLLVDSDIPSSNVLLSANGITPCNSADIAKKQALRYVIDASTLGRVMERIQGVDNMTKINGRQNGYTTSNREHLPQDLFNDLRGEVENYISSRINLKLMESSYLNGYLDEIEHDGLEHLFSNPPTKNSSTVSPSLPLAINPSDQHVFPDEPACQSTSIVTSPSPEDIRDTESTVDVRLAILAERDLQIHCHRSERVVDEMPTNTVPDETEETSPFFDLENSITVDSADSNSPHERSRQLHMTLAQFAWARTLFNQVSRQYILNPVRPDAILDEHLARVWRDRARTMMQEDERDGLPILQRRKRRTERTRVYSRYHLRNNVNQIAAGSQSNAPVNCEPLFKQDQQTPMKTTSYLSSDTYDVSTEWNRCCQAPKCSNSLGVSCSDGSCVRQSREYIRSPYTEHCSACHFHHRHHHYHYYHQFCSDCNSDHQLLHPRRQHFLNIENAGDLSSYMHIQNESNLFSDVLDNSASQLVNFPEQADQYKHITCNTPCMSILHDTTDEHKAVSVQKPFTENIINFFVFHFMLFCLTTDKLSQSSGIDETVTSSKLLTEIKRSLSTTDVEIECEVQNKIGRFNCLFEQYKATSASSSLGSIKQRDFLCSHILEGGRPTLSISEIASGVIVVYSLPGLMWPHVTYCPKTQPLTLDWFKQIVLRRSRGSADYVEPNRQWRYFFKCASEEFAPGVVYQECTLNDQLVPLWKGQVWAKIEIDD